MRKAKFSKKFYFALDPAPAWNRRTKTVRLSGWCIARSGSPLHKIRARLREQSFEAPLDRERPDAPPLFDAPCGFELEIPSPKGKLLAFQAAAADGEWQEVFSTEVRDADILSGPERQHWDEINLRARYVFWFEQPADWEQPVRTLYVSGWCLDRTGQPIGGIRARLGSRIIAANFGLARADLAERFPDNPSASQSGFALACPLPKRAATIRFQLLDYEKQWRTFSSRPLPGAARTATPDQLFAPPGVEYLPADSAARSRFNFWLDRPGDWSKKIRHLRVSGWCVAIAGGPVAEIRARIRGQILPARFGSVRPDVAIAFGQRAGALRSGFSLDAVVPRGSANVILEARSADGPWEIFFEQTVRGPIFREEHDPLREEVGDYDTWIKKYERLNAQDRAAIRRHVLQFERQPLISVLLPVYNSNRKFLRAAIASVRRQLYPHWQLCIVDDASTDPGIWPLLEKEARRESRIKILRRPKNGHISAASNDALRLATGEYVALLDHDDELAPTALYFVARELNRDPRLQFLYSDEDKLDKQGRRSDPYFKTDWNPDLFLCQNYISHLTVYAAELARQAGGFREGFEGSQDHDLALRVVEHIDAAQIHHIPRVLYHWRIDDLSTASFAEAKPYAQISGRRAVQEHLDRRGIGATVGPGYANYLRVHYTLPADPPLVSIIIPIRDRVALLAKCIDSVRAKTSYQNYEILVIDNESEEAATHDYFASLQSDERIRVHSIAGDFNYSRLNNQGVENARGSLVLLLNNDIEIINPDWLGEMVGQSLRAEVGAVGARLWYPDGTMQHGGVIVGAGGIASHAHARIRFEHGYFARAHLTQDFSAVTAACILIKKDLYLSLGGFDETNLPVAFNDVDFCLRLRQAGSFIIWTPHAELYHHESASRGLEDTEVKQLRFLAEQEYMRAKWGDVLAADPFYNPNLSLGENLFTLAFPPRLARPSQLPDPVPFFVPPSA